MSSFTGALSSTSSTTRKDASRASPTLTIGYRCS
jgi:hypothetical protein